MKEFRNDYSHYTNTDLSILRQWRTKLIDEELSSNPGTRDFMLIEASINILNTVIQHLSHPNSKPLQKTRRNSFDDFPTEGNTRTIIGGKKVIKYQGSQNNLSKKERKKLVKAMKGVSVNNNEGRWKREVFSVVNNNDAVMDDSIPFQCISSVNSDDEKVSAMSSTAPITSINNNANISFY